MYLLWVKLVKVLKNRHFIFGSVCFSLIFVILFRLMYVQVISGDDYVSSAQSKVRKTISVNGRRGDILDSNMLPLAQDEQCFNVEFYRDPTKKSRDDTIAYTRAICDMIEIVERNKGVVVDDFMINKDESGAFSFSYKNITEERWHGNFYLKKNAEGAFKTPDEAWNSLIQTYYVTELPYETQHKVLSVWQDMQMVTFLSIPAVVAYNVDFNTVAQIKARSDELPGIGIAQSTVRIYPRGDMAAHVIGYIGKMSDQETIDEYKSKGYTADDLIGISGIEKSMEDQLTGAVDYRQGMREVEKNYLGKITREISYKPPIDGNSVVLTLDSYMQMVTDAALKATIEEIRLQQELAMAEPKWQQKYADVLADYAENGREIKLASTGAAIVMDIHTGDIKAMSSYPSFDLNLFTSNIDNEALRQLLNDPNKPMFNRAIGSKSTPGSIFKMVPGLAGLMEGVVTPHEKIDDMGEYKAYVKSGQALKCWKESYWTHTQQDIEKALIHSCNYFFYTVGDRLKIDRLYSWAIKLGLGMRTGVELQSEVTSVVASQKSLYDADLPINQQGTYKPVYAAAAIKAIIVKAGEVYGVTYTDERVDEVTRELMDLVLLSNYALDELSAPVQHVLLEKLSLPADFISRRAMVNQILDCLRDIKWDPNETLKASIGQSIHQLTPIAVARYISALVNGGKVLSAQLVSKIISPEGTVVMDKQPSVVSELGDVGWALEYIKKGMKGVLQDEDEGTAAKYFTNYPYKDQIGAKTGTAQVSKLDVENNAWFVAFAPYDDPQIAIVVFIPNGFSGGMASLAVRDIVTYYMERDTGGGETVPLPGEMVQ